MSLGESLQPQSLPTVVTSDLGSKEQVVMPHSEQAEQFLIQHVDDFVGKSMFWCYACETKRITMTHDIFYGLTEKMRIDPLKSLRA